jgi:hypothetical protein
METFVVAIGDVNFIEYNDEKDARRALMIIDCLSHMGGGTLITPARIGPTGETPGVAGM